MDTDTVSRRCSTAATSSTKPFPNSYTGISAARYTCFPFRPSSYLCNIAVRVHSRAAGELAATMKSCRIRHPHLDPRRDTAGHVPHQYSRFVARRDTLCELDAFGVLQAVRKQARQHELGCFRRLPREAQRERLVDAAIDVSQLRVEVVNGRSEGHNLVIRDLGLGIRSATRVRRVQRVQT